MPSGGQLRAASPSSRHASRERLALRLVLRSASRSVLLACLIRPCGPHRLIRSLLPRRLAFFSSAHRLAPCLVSPGSPPHSTSETGRNNRRAIIDWRADGGRGHDCLLASWRWTDGGGCLPRMAMGGGRSSTADGCGRRAWLFACLGAIGGAARSSLLPVSSAHPISHHLIEGDLSFPFRPTPSRLLFSACLLGLVPPSPAGGCVGCGMACVGGRAGLFACLLSCPCRSLTAFVRSLLYAPCRLRRCAYLWRRGAFYGLFLPLTCRRWRF